MAFWLTGRSVGWLADWLAGRLAGWQVGLPLDTNAGGAAEHHSWASHLGKECRLVARKLSTAERAQCMNLVCLSVSPTSLLLKTGLPAAPSGTLLNQAGDH
ncbi:hypothetical protein E2C01_096131 [Portunus trituberculatus]|uniref:Uncharacterized protein n=1 Tax=Portunus trituberculatus TaxID=210409 RepID=A0A5B7K1Z8_PORTR|nr:hypothetical protein [Portunus trituberculatus]